MASGAGIGPDGSGPEAAPGPPSRSLAFVLAALVTGVGVLGALYLGAWAFDVRRFTTHEGRLARLLAHAPTLAQVDQAFKDEGTLLVGAAEDEAALHTLALRLGGGRAAAVEASGRRHARTQAYAAGDMIYFVHFDERRVMRAFALVSR